MYHKDTNLAREDFNHISKLLKIAKTKERSPYKKYTDKDRYNMGKYASESGPIAAVRNVPLEFYNLNEITARSIKKECEEELN